MNVVVIFDVSDQEEKVREALIKNGYHKTWRTASEGIRYHLPKYCLWKPNVNLPDVKNEFIKIVKELDSSIDIQRLLVLPASPWDAIVGVEY